MTETWKPVIGFEGLYEVSNLGRVRSLDRVWTQVSRLGLLHAHSRRGQMLRPGIASHGYPTVMLGRACGSRTVHSLVAEAFIGPCPKGQEVRHRDGNRANPAASNLEYGTRAENIVDASLHDRRKVSRRTVEFVKTAVGTHQAVAEAAGISPSHVHNIRAGKQRVRG